MNDEITGKAKGGVARAEALSSEERKEIGRKGAAARWDNTLPTAICGSIDRPLRIGDLELECYVLADGTRVLSQAGFMVALGRHRKANVRREGGEEQIPAILQGKAINPFISQEVFEKSKPIIFRTPRGTKANGFRADLLPAVCEVYLKARDAGVLPNNQFHVARQSEILIRALAHVGIIALVDEATGYQDVRDRQALQAILDQYLRKELAAWAKRFPDEFYKEMFRLKGWPMNPLRVKRPGVVGKYTNNIVYERLAPGILEELEKRNPKDEKGNRKGKHHQLLTDEVGHPALAQHLYAVIGFMRANTDWDNFLRMLDKAYPRKNDTLDLGLPEPNEIAISSSAQPQPS